MTLAKWLTNDPSNHIVRIYYNEYRETPTEHTFIADAIEFPGANQKLIAHGSGWSPQDAFDAFLVDFTKKTSDPVEVYVPTIEDWKKYPEINYIATDPCGCVNGFKVEPDVNIYGFFASYMRSFRVCEGGTEKVKGWRESLVKRPANV